MLFEGVCVNYHHHGRQGVCNPGSELPWMSPLAEMSAMKALNALSALNARTIMWPYKNNSFGTLGWENDHYNSYKFDL